MFAFPFGYKDTSEENYRNPHFLSSHIVIETEKVYKQEKHIQKS